MEKKHTPGPWACVEADGVTVRHPQVYADTGPVCNATWLGDSKISELRANARLLASAPAMLSALLEVETYLAEREDVIDGDYGQPAPNAEMTLLQEVRATITKATGKE